jgi:beta-glucosidase
LRSTSAAHPFYPEAQVRHLRFVIISLFFLALAASAHAPFARAQEATPAYRNPALPVEQRVDDLISRMTLEEKSLQMQNAAPAIPRLGVPAYNWWGEALHGVARAGYATVFPQAIGMAATFNPEIIRREGRVIAKEARAKFNQAQRDKNYTFYFGLTFWSPNINIFRDPRWGRGQETYGEDPYLAGRLGAAFVKGLQGDDPKYLETVGTPKHYAVHSGPEPDRHGFNVNPSKRDLEETYLAAFRMAVTESKAESVMAAYNAIYGKPAAASAFLLQETLRDGWGFKGYVTSDCYAVTDILNGHKFVPDMAHAAAVAVRAGTDLTCGEEYVTLPKAVAEGLIKESELDAALRRLFTARMKLGLFDPPAAVPFNAIPMSVVGAPEHRRLALEVARQSIVLLKNDGTLPLKPAVKTIAVVGPNAESMVSLEGNYNGAMRNPVQPLSGIRRQFGQARVLYSQGSPHVSGFPVQVPSTVLHPPGMPNLAGLRGEYFSNREFAGKPAHVRTDRQVLFNWSAASPAPGVSSKAFSVRWTGTFTPPVPGRYTFGINQVPCWPCDDHALYRVYFDGKLASETESVRHGTPVKPFELDFADANPKDIRVEYSHESPVFAAGIELTWQPPAVALREEALAIARKADVVVAFIGLSPELEGEEMGGFKVEGFAGGDRTDIALPRVQQELLEALSATGKPLVVVLMSGSAVAVNWAQQHANAILAAWYPGESGGTAIAETLAGMNNPAGRLPVTFYASLDQLPPFREYSMNNRTYRYFRGEPLYRFGYGLSYSTFAYSNLKLSSDQVQAGQPLNVEVDVKNTSPRSGNEVPQLYIEYPSSEDGALRALKGFERIHLAAGETRRVKFTLSPRDLSRVTEDGEHVIQPASYAVYVGGGQPKEGTGARASFQITGEKKLPR